MFGCFFPCYFGVFFPECAGDVFDNPSFAFCSFCSQHLAPWDVFDNPSYAFCSCCSQLLAPWAAWAGRFGRPAPVSVRPARGPARRTQPPRGQDMLAHLPKPPSLFVSRPTWPQPGRNTEPIPCTAEIVFALTMATCELVTPTKTRAKKVVCG